MSHTEGRLGAFIVSEKEDGPKYIGIGKENQEAPAEGVVVAKCGELGGELEKNSIEDARRLVALWNLEEGVSTKDLEEMLGVLDKMDPAYRRFVIGVLFETKRKLLDELLQDEELNAGLNEQYRISTEGNGDPV